jgi:hypothetical protein
MKKTSLILILAILFLNAFNTQAQVAQCTGFKTTTLPLAGDYGGFGQFAVTRQTIANPDPTAPAPVSVFVPSNATAQNKVPVVFFAHGFGGTSYLFYETLMRQMASNGYIVVFSPYTANILATHAVRYNQLWNGFLTAVQQNSAIMDTTRIGFAGHSYGAGATPEMARRAVAQGWGANGLFMFIMAAWYNWGTNLEQIPASAKMIVQVYWDDETNEHLISQNDIWNKLAANYRAKMAGHSPLANLLLVKRRSFGSRDKRLGTNRSGDRRLRCLGRLAQTARAFGLYVHRKSNG